ncbi:MAG: lytic murein transglycosylase [Chromatiales bacterium]|jgi:lytic murein transglycosylase|nr:lytic murein transglycosylase [Chromatiales bacterium]
MKNICKSTGSVGTRVAVVALLIASLSVNAADNCRNTKSFSKWLMAFKVDASRAGVSDTAIGALRGVALDRSVISRDRAKGVFAQDFLTFSNRMVSAYRLKHGRTHLERKRELFARIESEFGVPGAVITAFWALETDFGANNGNFPTLTALASLAWDCRRPELFRPQLIDALRLIDEGDLSPDEMLGAHAGELGQVQFLPSDYKRSAVDYDGDGRRDLIGSVPDALASAASLLRDFGWHSGEPWLEEVRVPESLQWEKADVYQTQPWSYWRDAGVRRINIDAEPAASTPLALLLPSGRRGPAFIAYRNFAIYLQWNESLIYTTTAAYLATRLAGASRLGIVKLPEAPLELAEIKTLQRALVRRGHDVGKVDGIIGARTRAAVRSVQIEFGMGADAYPSRELLRLIAH